MMIIGNFERVECLNKCHGSLHFTENFFFSPAHVTVAFFCYFEREKKISCPLLFLSEKINKDKSRNP